MKEINLEEYKKLLECNLNNHFDFDDKMIISEFNAYTNAIKNNWINYPESVKNLQQWRDSHGVYEYPNIYPLHKMVVDIITDLNCRDICEIGAGAGCVAKQVYALNKNIKLTCVEGSDDHIEQMRENFRKDSNVFKPYIDVKADIIKNSIQDLDIEDNLFDMVYTVTVLMHIPFILLPLAIKNISRLTNKYVLHVENTNEVINAVVMGQQKSELNRLCLDYKKIYELLDFKTLKNEYVIDVHSGQKFLLYLGKKN